MASANWFAYQQYIWKKYQGIPMEPYYADKDYSKLLGQTTTVIGSQYQVTGQSVEMVQASAPAEQVTQPAQLSGPPGTQPHEQFYGMSIPYEYLTPEERFNFQVQTGGQYKAQYAPYESNYNIMATGLKTVSTPNIQFTEAPATGTEIHNTSVYVPVEQAAKTTKERQELAIGPAGVWYEENVVNPVMSTVTFKNIDMNNPVSYTAQHLTYGVVNIISLPMIALSPETFIPRMIQSAKEEPVGFGIEMLGAFAVMKGAGYAWEKSGIFKTKPTYEVTEVKWAARYNAKRFQLVDMRGQEVPYATGSFFDVTKGTMAPEEFAPRDFANPLAKVTDTQKSATSGNIGITAGKSEGLISSKNVYTIKSDVPPKIPNVEFLDVGTATAGSISFGKGLVTTNRGSLQFFVPYEKPEAPMATNVFKAPGNPTKNIIDDLREPFLKWREDMDRMARVEVENRQSMSSFKGKPVNSQIEPRMFGKQRLLLKEEDEYYPVPDEMLKRLNESPGVPISVREITKVGAIGQFSRVLGNLGVISLGKIGSEGRVNAVDMASKYDLKSQTMLKSRQNEITRIDAKVLEDTKTSNILKFKEMQMLKQRSLQKTMVRQSQLRRQRTEFRLKYPVMPAPVTSTSNIFRIPSFGSDIKESNKKAASSIKKMSREYRYETSLYSLTTGLRSNKKQSTITGLELRPIIGRRRR